MDWKKIGKNVGLVLLLGPPALGGAMVAAIVFGVVWAAPFILIYRAING